MAATRYVIGLLLLAHTPCCKYWVSRGPQYTGSRDVAKGILIIISMAEPLTFGQRYNYRVPSDSGSATKSTPKGVEVRMHRACGNGSTRQDFLSSLLT